MSEMLVASLALIHLLNLLGSLSKEFPRERWDLIAGPSSGAAVSGWRKCTLSVDLSGSLPISRQLALSLCPEQAGATFAPL